MSQEINPYAPPASDVSAGDSPDTMELASKGRRFMTQVVDYIAYLLFSAIVGVIFGVASRMTGVDFLRAIPQMLLGILLFVAYYLVFEGLWARTPGKVVCGTVIIDEAGGKPTFGQVVKRTLARHIPFEAFSFFGQRGWHDSLSKTYVVMKNKA